MKLSNVFTFFLGAVFILAILALPAFLFPKSLSFKPFGLNDVSQLLTFLFLVSLFLERSLEVFISTWRLPREEKIDNDIQNNERVIAEKKALREKKIEQPQIVTTKVEREISKAPPKVKTETAVENIPANTAKLTDELDEEMVKLGENKQKRSQYKSETRKIALWTALFFSLLISAAGIRSLDTLVEPTGLNSIQQIVFRCLDTLLTGGLIAGGSDGIHKVTQVFTTYFEETRNGMKDKSG
jgi:hypothetical protein